MTSANRLTLCRALALCYSFHYVCEPARNYLPVRDVSRAHSRALIEPAGKGRAEGRARAEKIQLAGYARRNIAWQS